VLGSPDARVLASKGSVRLFAPHVLHQVHLKLHIVYKLLEHLAWVVRSSSKLARNPYITLLFDLLQGFDHAENDSALICCLPFINSRGSASTIYEGRSRCRICAIGCGVGNSPVLLRTPGR
jgi:hypothetical protein